MSFRRLQSMLGTAELVVNVSAAIVEGALSWHSFNTEKLPLGAMEIWAFYNSSPDALSLESSLYTSKELPSNPSILTVVPEGRS